MQATWTGIERRQSAGALAREVLGAGILGGLFAGFAMMVFSILDVGGRGLGFWTPPRLIDGTFDGVMALVGSGGVVIAGLAIHFAVSIFWGVLFALIVGRSWKATQALGAGVFFGFAVWTFMTYLIMPWSNPTMTPRVHMMMGTLIVAHVIFGASLFLVPPLRRSLQKSTTAA